MKPTVAIDYRGVVTMARELARVSGKTCVEVYRLEGASAVKIAALRVKIASLAAIRRQVAERHGSKYRGDGGEVSINTRTHAGRVWFTQQVGSRAERVAGPAMPGKEHEKRIVKSGGYYLVYDAGGARGHHLPDPIWAEFLTTRDGQRLFIRQRISELSKRRGIERLSWLQIGDALGVQLSTVAPSGNLNEARARAASVRGRQWQNGKAAESGAGSRYGIVLSNDSPSAIKRFGQSRLNSAINQRARGFAIAARKGLLDDLERRAARWPGIFVRPV